MKEPYFPFPDSVKRIGIAVSSKAPEHDAFHNAVNFLQSYGIACVVPTHALESGPEDYFATDERRRAEDFNSLLADTSIQLILCARGGYGSGYLLDSINWDLLRKRALPVCGYSDITALHCGMFAHHAGVPVTTQMLTSLSQVVENEFTARSMKRTLQIAMGESVPEMNYRLNVISNPRNQSVTAPFFAANLAVLTSLCGTKHLPDFQNTIIAVEDVDESPRKIDRMLLQMDLCGIFDRAAAVLFGKFSGDCGTDEEQIRIMRRFADRHPNKPFFSGLPFGHTLPSLSFLCGRCVTITCDGILTM